MRRPAGEVEQHPRARALRVGYILMTVWFALLAVAVAVLARDIAAGLVCQGLMAMGFGIATVAADRYGAAPNVRAVERVRRPLVLMLVASAVLGVVGIALVPVATQAALWAWRGGFAVTVGISATSLWAVTR